MSPDASWVRLRDGDVVAVAQAEHGLVRCEVLVDGERGAAIAYAALVGTPRVGDRVTLNTTARHLGLGTGGVDLIVAIESLAHSPSPERSVRALATALAPGGLLVVIDDMPLAAARGTAAACEAELALFRDLLDADVVRESHIVAGDRCCSYRITPRA